MLCEKQVTKALQIVSATQEREKLKPHFLNR